MLIIPLSSLPFTERKALAVHFFLDSISLYKNYANDFFHRKKNNQNKTQIIGYF